MHESCACWNRYISRQKAAEEKIIELISLIIAHAIYTRSSGYYKAPVYLFDLIQNKVRGLLDMAKDGDRFRRIEENRLLEKYNIPKTPPTGAYTKP